MQSKERVLIQGLINTNKLKIVFEDKKGKILSYYLKKAR